MKTILSVGPRRTSTSLVAGHLAGLLLLVILLAGCGGGSRSVVFHDAGAPSSLAAWNLLRIEDGALHLNDRVVPYELNSPLFTDYAQKLRTVWMPEGTSASYGEEDFDYPVGTIISKTFYYPRVEGSENRLVEASPRTDRASDGLDLRSVRLIETRLLVHRSEGWVAFPYVWNEAQSEARLEVAGALFRLSLEPEVGGETEEVPYIVPDANQCAGCHATNHTEGTVRPIGPKARHLNRSYPYATGSENQLAYWSRVGLLSGLDDPARAPRQVPWTDVSESLDDRARSYLDINCGHCHNPVGPADTSGLFLDIHTRDLRRLGACKPPVAAGRGSGNLHVAIEPGQPDQSIMVFRMASTDPGEAMPELGRSSVHREGVELIRRWIASLDEDCSL